MLSTARIKFPEKSFVVCDANSRFTMLYGVTVAKKTSVIVELAKSNSYFFFNVMLVDAAFNSYIAFYVTTSSTAILSVVYLRGLSFESDKLVMSIDSSSLSYGKSVAMLL